MRWSTWSRLGKAQYLPTTAEEETSTTPSPKHARLCTVRWCSWLSRQSNTLKVSGSSPGRIIPFAAAAAVGAVLFCMCDFDNTTGIPSPEEHEIEQWASFWRKPVETSIGSLPDGKRAAFLRLRFYYHTANPRVEDHGIRQASPTPPRGLRGCTTRIPFTPVYCNIQVEKHTRKTSPIESDS